MSNEHDETEKIMPDDGLYFGLGVFETIALENGTPIFFREHLVRMVTSLKRLGINVKTHEIVTLAKNACQDNANRGSKVLKLVATEKNRLASVRTNLYSDERRTEGFVCEFSKVRRNETSPLVTMKTLNYGDCILLKREALSHGIDEPIFLNTKGLISEGATSNVFALIDGEVVTPPVSCGLLPGVMRDFAIRVTGAKEHPLLPEELMRADEVFLTNSLMGAMPVRRIGTQVFSHGGYTVAQQINEAYREEVSATCERWNGEEDPWVQLSGR
ncbi:MAG: aminotransferase class IV [Coriobacteriales bacterium]|jgi:branched-subunit amino acid aminotransferase/4-amino-4-deoxychorismate lyase